MKAVYGKQKWEGYFTYGEGYGLDIEDKQVRFILDIEIDEDSFTGTSVDFESKDLFDTPATIKGFFEDDTMSFVLKYPCTYFVDENGSLIIDKNQEHTDIHYFGYLDQDKKVVEGNWEMVTAQEKYDNGYLENILSGDFWIKRV